MESQGCGVIQSHGKNDLGCGELVPPCLYTPDGRVEEIKPFEGALRASQLRHALGGAYQIMAYGDNFIAITTGGIVGGYNPIISDIVEASCYGPAVIGHRSFFTGGA